MIRTCRALAKPRDATRQAVNLCSFLLVMSCGAFTVAAEEPADITPLMQKLGGRNFTEREQAEQALRKQGWTIRDTLLRERPLRSPEWKYRADRLLRQIEQDEYERQLNLLTQNGSAALPEDHAIVGWKRFAKALDDSPATALRFANIQRHQLPLFVIAAFHHQELADVLRTRIQDLVLMERQADGLDVDARTYAGLLMLLANLPGDADEPLTTVAIKLLNRNDFRALLAEGSQRSLFEALYGLWLERKVVAGETDRLMLALQLSIPTGIVSARRLFGDGVPKTNGVYVLLALARFGDPTDEALLTRGLEDGAVLGTTMVNDRPMTSQVRDAALVGLVLRAAQDPADFGMSWVRRHPLYLAVPATIGFPDDSTRRESLRRWREFADQRHQQ